MFSLLVICCGIDKYVDLTNFKKISDWQPSNNDNNKEPIQKAKFYLVNQ